MHFAHTTLLWILFIFVGFLVVFPATSQVSSITQRDQFSRADEETICHWVLRGDQPSLQEMAIRAAEDRKLDTCLSDLRKVFPLIAARRDTEKKVEESHQTSLPQTIKPSITDISSCAPTIDDYRAAVGSTDAWGGTRIRFTIESTGKLSKAEIVRSAGSTRAHRMLDRTGLSKLAECAFSSGMDSRKNKIDGTFEVEIDWGRNRPPRVHQQDFQLPSNYTAHRVPSPQENNEPTAFLKCPSGGVKNNCWDKSNLATGDQFVGVFRNGERNGEGILYSKDGTIISSGLWDPYRQLVAAYPIDSSRFPFESTASGSLSAPLGFAQQEPQATASPSAGTDLGKFERDRMAAEIEVERKRRQELEDRLATETRERERLLAAARERERPPSLPPTTAPTIRSAHALVIGNAAYPGSGRLENPVNDATAISHKLRVMGFTVTTVTDANRQRLVQAMSQFRRSAASAEVSLLFYSGHGVQVFGKNYMLPIDMDHPSSTPNAVSG
jgi:hypothetical protein